MKNKIIVTKENYKEIMLKRAIIVCWVLLALAFIVKIFGGNFFNIMCESKEFIKICNYIDNSWLSYLIYYLSFITTSLLLLVIASYKKSLSKKKKLIYCIIITFVWIAKLLIQEEVICINIIVINVFDFVVLISLLFIFTKNIKMSLLSVLFMFIYTFISASVKNIGLQESLSYTFLEYSIYMIDYYILLILTYLYYKKRRI